MRPHERGRPFDRGIVGPTLTSARGGRADVGVVAGELAMSAGACVTDVDGPLLPIV